MLFRNVFDTVPDRWLGFELSILRRLNFASVALPFGGEPELEVHLKRWGVRVATNDVAQWAATKALARVVNNFDTLTEAEVDLVLDEAYVPGYRLLNPSLRRWFSETDAWWFDNVRRNIERLETPIQKSLALTYGLMIGDYVFSFDDHTRELRQPLSRAFRRIWLVSAAPVNNGLVNTSTNLEPLNFVGEQTDVECLFLRLPPNEHPGRAFSRGDAPWAWREEWIRGTDNFWKEFGASRIGKFGARVETKQQYLSLLAELLAAADPVPLWAISFVETGLVSTEEIVETISQFRPIETMYTKDFSETSGTRAVLITTVR